MTRSKQRGAMPRIVAPLVVALLLAGCGDAPAPGTTPSPATTPPDATPSPVTASPVTPSPVTARPAPEVPTPMPWPSMDSSATEAVAGSGPFRLTFRIERTTWAPDEPIQGSATLEYLGDAMLEVSGSGSGYFGFDLRELTGPRDRLGPAWTDDCAPSTLDADQPEVQRLAPISGGWDMGHPDAPFYRQLLETGEFRLPPGVWELIAIATFIPAPACAVDSIMLRAPLRVVVGG